MFLAATLVINVVLVLITGKMRGVIGIDVSPITTKAGYSGFLVDDFDLVGSFRFPLPCSFCPALGNQLWAFAA